ncbi:MAG: PD-(D/E)XK nuclease family protein [Kiritimatiellia bacterium]
MTDDENCLRDFLTNISCLDPIENSIGRVSIFDVLGMARNEIRHSRVLRWLLDPNENHGLGSLFLRAFLQRVCMAGGDALDLLTADLDTFSVFHEYKHIDLLLVSRASGIVVAIENKVDSSEHDNQLKRYEDVLRTDFPANKFKWVFVYLTPDGDDASRPDWLPIPYWKIVEVIEYCRRQKVLAPDVALMIEHYQNLLTREFMNKDDMADICNKIYKEHKRALDLIFEFKEDRASIARDLIVGWFASEDGQKSGLILDREHTCKSYIRFSTAKLESIIPLLPEGKKSGWNSSHSAYYEIVNRRSITLKLSCSAQGLSPEDIARLWKTFGVKKAAKDWQWTTLHNFGRSVVLPPSKEDDEIWGADQIQDFMKTVVKAVHEFEKDL